MVGFLIGTRYRDMARRRARLPARPTGVISASFCYWFAPPGYLLFRAVLF